jgi:hypothetical protein
MTSIKRTESKKEMRIKPKVEHTMKENKEGNYRPERSRIRKNMRNEKNI